MTNDFTTEQKIYIWKVQTTPLKEFHNAEFWFNTLKIKLKRKDLIEILLYKGVATKQDYFKWWSWSELVNGVNSALGTGKFNYDVLD